jgi:hypothetical protein
MSIAIGAPLQSYEATEGDAARADVLRADTFVAITV